MLRRITGELRHHVLFTALGAVSGIVIIVVIVWGNFLPRVFPISQNIFYVLHPAHIVLSALVTTTLYVRYRGPNIWMAILIGYTGSIGITTISDSIIPYLGETLLNLPHKAVHIGFIEEPLLTNPAAFLGIGIGYWKGTTKFPHFGHVLISTWASLFHIIMALGQTVSWVQVVAIFLFLFLAVWLPCCISDIVFPLLFIRKGLPPQKV